MSSEAGSPGVHTRGPQQQLPKCFGGYLPIDLTDPTGETVAPKTHNVRTRLNETLVVTDFEIPKLEEYKADDGYEVLLCATCCHEASVQHCLPVSFKRGDSDVFMSPGSRPGSRPRPSESSRSRTDVSPSTSARPPLAGQLSYDRRGNHYGSVLDPDSPFHATLAMRLGDGANLRKVSLSGPIVTTLTGQFSETHHDGYLFLGKVVGGREVEGNLLTELYFGSIDAMLLVTESDFEGTSTHNNFHIPPGTAGVGLTIEEGLDSEGRHFSAALKNPFGESSRNLSDIVSGIDAEFPVQVTPSQEDTDLPPGSTFPGPAQARTLPVVTPVTQSLHPEAALPDLAGRQNVRASPPGVPKEALIAQTQQSDLFDEFLPHPVSADPGPASQNPIRPSGHNTSVLHEVVTNASSHGTQQSAQAQPHTAPQTNHSLGAVFGLDVNQFMSQVQPSGHNPQATHGHQMPSQQQHNHNSAQHHTQASQHGAPSSAQAAPLGATHASAIQHSHTTLAYRKQAISQHQSMQHDHLATINQYLCRQTTSAACLTVICRKRITHIIALFTPADRAH